MINKWHSSYVYLYVTGGAPDEEISFHPLYHFNRQRIYSVCPQFARAFSKNFGRTIFIFCNFLYSFDIQQPPPLSRI